ncbi:dual specificity protein phosphatase family protein [Candidatus Bathyarchaeota archaeon]|nr:dual specificity protein phosphatase family protein [Candidatus Bathyarchaeota archaeon]
MAEHSEIIPGKLVIGRKPIGNFEFTRLKLLGVSVIIDLDASPIEKVAAKARNLDYESLKIENNYEPIDPDLLKKVVEIIDQYVKKGKMVYLHCSAGLGRAPTCAAAYLIYKGVTYEEAIKKIKDARPQAWTRNDENYPKRLREFESKIKLQ